MESQLNRRSAADQAGVGNSPVRAIQAYAGSPQADSSLLILVRVPDLNRPPQEPAEAATAPPASALYEANQSQQEPPAQQQAPAAEAEPATPATKTWRSDSKHEPFRPEKYNSNLTTKLVAGTLSLGAVVLVYFALFGTGPDDAASTASEAKMAEIEENWTDQQGELQVDLGSEGQIDDSSSLAPAFASENTPPRSEPTPVEQPRAEQVRVESPAMPSIATRPEQYSMPAEAESAPQYSSATPAESPASPQKGQTETRPPQDSTLTGVLPWRAQQQATDNREFTPAADETPSNPNDMQLEAPVTQTAPTQPGYAREYPATGGRYPTTNAPSGNYPTTDSPAASYPSTAYADGYSSSPSPSQANDPAAAYQAQNPYPQTGARYPSTSPAGAPAASVYPTTATPADSYAPPAGRYPQTNSNDTSPGWRR